MMEPDYRIRPAKHVERLLIVDALRRLRHFHSLLDYAYVGFGAQYFVDFTLLHKALGVTRMTSLEENKQLFKRCVFNRPFDSVAVLSGSSAQHFSSLPFDEPTIAWADYTGKIRASILGDVETLCLRLPPTSVILLTVNVNADEVTDPPEGRLAALRERVGDAAVVPLGTKDSDLDGWSNASVVRQIIEEQIHQSLTLRSDGTTYHQLFNFHYRDTAKMLTTGGILLTDEVTPQFQECQWETVEAYCPGPEAIRIELPSLTMKEMALLDEQLPAGKDKLDAPGLTAKELSAYAAYYRYYPRYALVDV